MKPGVYEHCWFCGGHGEVEIEVDGAESLLLPCPNEICVDGLVPHDCDKSKVEWGES